MATWEESMALLTPTVQTAINEIVEDAGTYEADFAVFLAAGDMVDSLRREKLELLEALQSVEAQLTAAGRAFYGTGTRSALQAALAGWKDNAERARAAIARATGQ